MVLPDSGVEVAQLCVSVAAFLVETLRLFSVLKSKVVINFISIKSFINGNLPYFSCWYFHCCLSAQEECHPIEKFVMKNDLITK